MDKRNLNAFKVIRGKYHNLLDLHDEIMSQLDSDGKKGINELLKKNSESCKKLIYPYLKFVHNNAAVMTALSAVLEAHAKECYVIGFLDSEVNGRDQNKGSQENS